MSKILYYALLLIPFALSSVFADELIVEDKAGKDKQKGERLDKHFQHVDADSSGDVTLEEFLNVKRKRKKGSEGGERKHKKGSKKKGEASTDKAESTDGEKAKRKRPKMSKEDMEKKKEEFKKRKTEAFENADADNSGALNKEEFGKMMKAFFEKMRSHKKGHKKPKEDAAQE